MPGSNATNVTGTISGLYPPTSAPVDASALLIAGAFSVDLDILPGAQPFSIVAAGDGGNVIIAVNPTAGTWQATLSEPTLASGDGDFTPTTSGFNVIWDFSTCLTSGICTPFPGNQSPALHMDPAAVNAMNLLPSPNSCPTLCTSANASYAVMGVIPAGGHFSIGPNTLSNIARFGGFIQIPEVGPSARTASFSLWVDGKQIAANSVGYNVVQP